MLFRSQALNAMDPDLEAFKQRGGKLIMYHGFADPFVTPMSSIAYYNRVTGEMHPGRHKGNDGTNAAGQKRTVDFARLFMVPGMWHCAGGPGAVQLRRLHAAHAVGRAGRRARPHHRHAHPDHGLSDSVHAAALPVPAGRGLQRRRRDDRRPELLVSDREVRCG